MILIFVHSLYQKGGQMNNKKVKFTVHLNLYTLLSILFYKRKAFFFFLKKIKKALLCKNAFLENLLGHPYGSKDHFF